MKRDKGSLTNFQYFIHFSVRTIISVGGRKIILLNNIWRCSGTRGCPKITLIRDFSCYFLSITRLGRFITLSSRRGETGGHQQFELKQGDRRTERERERMGVGGRVTIRGAR